MTQRWAKGSVTICGAKGSMAGGAWQPARTASEIANGNKKRFFIFDIIFIRPAEIVLSVVLT